MPFPFLPILALAAVGTVVAIASKKSGATLRQGLPPGNTALAPQAAGTWEVLGASVPVFTAPGNYTATGNFPDSDRVKVGSYLVVGLHRTGDPLADPLSSPSPLPGTFTALFRVTAVKSSWLGPQFAAQFIRKIALPVGTLDPFPGAPTPPDFTTFLIGPAQIRDATPPM